ncbi:MAG: AAA-like domain-containing protein [Nostocaceae cyanobacterium]|nr:AAA-like domain-containing protein [Nostocaceae cyanobacterium]
MHDDSHIRILFLTAEPTDTARLRLQQELRDIQERLRQANQPERFQLDFALSARPGDMSQKILHFQPHIVHFSGHGASTGELCFENESGTTGPVTPKALADLFRLVADQVNCVVLNACYSDIQAQAIVEHIPFVIGMKKAIGDQAAINFSIGFYTALGANRSIDNAFDIGCLQIQMEDIPENLTPVLRIKRADIFHVQRSSIEDYCYEEIQKPASLIRIKAPHQMGKTLLMNQILIYAREKRYQRVRLNCRDLVDSTVSTLEEFLQSFCVGISNNLNLPNKFDDYWNNSGTPVDRVTRYFQNHVLRANSRPLILALDNVDLIFEHPEIAPDFCKLIRNWHTNAQQGDLDSHTWQKLRLIIVHSTEVYASLDINNSPLSNVGFVVDLPEFKTEEVHDLVQLHGLNWTDAEVQQLMDLVGGHPLLVRKCLEYIRLHNSTLEQFLEVAPTLNGPYNNHLQELLEILENNSDLNQAFKEVVNAEENQPIQLRFNQKRNLQRLGLITLEKNNLAQPRCKLYRQFFRINL